MSTRGKPQESEEPQNTAFKELKEELYEEQQRRGQYVVNGDDTEPPGRGQYAAGVDNTETLEGIETIKSDATTP